MMHLSNSQFVPTGSSSPPSMWLAATELARASAELITLPIAWPDLNKASNGDGHTVLVLPGFGGTDASTYVMRRYLAGLGYDVREWGLGRNLGPKVIGQTGQRLISSFEKIYAGRGRKVSLVGWSLGGIMARMIARRMPSAVRQVVTLGSPYRGGLRANNVWRAYEWLTGEAVDAATTRDLIQECAQALEVPSTSIFTKADGIVAWQNCIEPENDITQSLEVSGSHCGLGANPAVLTAVADRLAQSEKDWRRYTPSTTSR